MESFKLKASDGHEVACYRWLPENPSGVVQIAHGMGEHAQRYDWIASLLAAAGFAVYANDHRGHGGTRGAVQGYMGPDGWNRCLADMYEFGAYIKAQHGAQKLCLLGHSMGSMLSQQYITRYGESISALVLSGSPGFKAPPFAFIQSLIQKAIMRFEHWRFGADGQSDVMQNALFASSNDPFDAPGATGYEWLSRDSAEVVKYVNDPECGFVLSVGSLMDMFSGTGVSQYGAAIDKVPSELPIYVFSGSADPVGGDLGSDIDRMVAAYREHGLNVTDYTLYPEGRHEMFNETNKQEVADELVLWLSKHIR